MDPQHIADFISNCFFFNVSISSLNGPPDMCILWRYQPCCFSVENMSQCTSSAATSSLPPYWVCHIQTLSPQNQVQLYTRTSKQEHVTKWSIHVNRHTRVNREKKKLNKSPQRPQACGKILNDWTLSASTRHRLQRLRLKYFRWFKKKKIFQDRNSRRLRSYGR